MKKAFTFLFLFVTHSQTILAKDQRIMIEPKELLSLPVSAASGLLKIEDDFYTVADDELFLLKFSTTEKFEKFNLIQGELPEDKKERKKKKADFEALYFSGEKIIAIPSFSKPNRIKVASFDLKNNRVDLYDRSDFHKKAMTFTEELNIEGASIVNEELWLFQRGNGAQGTNGIFKLNPGTFELKSFHKIDLGELKGQNLGFTDAVKSGDFIFFLAVVETAKSTYDDGKYLGAVFGKMDLNGKILMKEELNSSQKPEGLWVEDGVLYFVTDADDRNISSRFYKAKIPY